LSSAQRGYKLGRRHVARDERLSIALFHARPL
jgi:hypothetical protein